MIRRARFGVLPAILCGLPLILPVPAHAQAEPLVAQSSRGGDVGKLWKEFPLRDGTVTPDASPARPAARPTPQPTPAGRSQSRAAPPRQATEPEDAGHEFLISVGVATIAAFAAGVVLRRRRRTTVSPPRAEAAAQSPLPDHVEGTTERNGIGAFAGYVEYEQHNGETGAGVERMVLVRDPSRDAPVWVRHSEITTRREGDGPHPALEEGSLYTGRFREPSRDFARPGGTG